MAAAHRASRTRRPPCSLSGTAAPTGCGSRLWEQRINLLPGCCLGIRASGLHSIHPQTSSGRSAQAAGRSRAPAADNAHTEPHPELPQPEAFGEPLIPGLRGMESRPQRRGLPVAFGQPFNTTAQIGLDSDRSTCGRWLSRTIAAQYLTGQVLPHGVNRTEIRFQALRSLAGHQSTNRSGGTVGAQLLRGVAPLSERTVRAS